MQQPVLRIETKTSEPIRAGNTTVHLTSQVFQLRLPFLMNGGLIYHRPVSVTTAPGTPDERVVPIVDVTRLVLVCLFVNALVSALIVGAAFRRGRADRRDGAMERHFESSEV